MRDKIFIAEHRGGLLNKEQHQQLVKWACNCTEHVLPLIGRTLDKRLSGAILIAKEWASDNATTGDAMKASVMAHAVAREFSDPVSKAVARSVGHAAASAHMADHSLGAALYALKAVKYAGKSTDAERKWQNEQLPFLINDLVLNSRIEKEKAFNL